MADAQEVTAIEYRVCWAASSNASFRGASEWTNWCELTGDEEATADEIERTLSEERGGQPTGAFPDALQEAMDGSGFEYWVETREVR